MSIRVKINSKRVRAAFGRLARELDFRPVMAQEMENLAEHAQAHHRFITRSGMLERSVQPSISFDGKVGKVELNRNIAEYGPFIHRGFRSWSPDPFLFEALKDRSPAIRRAFEVFVARAVKKAGF